MSLSDAISLIKETGSRCLVVKNNNKLLGIVTEGDLLRVISRDRLSDIRIEQIMSKNCHYLPEIHSRNDIINIFMQKNALIIPVLTTDKEIIKIYDIRDFIH